MRTIARIAVQRLCPSQDVLGRVVVPVGHVPTRRAGMGPDRERFLHDLPAVRAELRGEVRRYLVHPATGAFSLEAEDVDELRPPRVADGPCKVVVLDYVAHPQVLHGENGVLVDVLAGRLVGMVLALAGDLEVLLSDPWPPSCASGSPSRGEKPCAAPAGVLSPHAGDTAGSRPSLPRSRLRRP